MSRRVKERLWRMKILQKTDHDDRVELDRMFEEKTGKHCDIGVADLSDDEKFLDLSNRVYRWLPGWFKEATRVMGE